MADSQTQFIHTKTDIFGRLMHHPRNPKTLESYGAEIQPKAHPEGLKGPTGVSNFTRVEGVRPFGSESSTSLPSTSTQSLNEKPWKKHHNVKKKEKLRRQL